MSDNNQNIKNQEREKIKVQLSNIESFLLKSQYLNKNSVNKKHIDNFNQILSKQEYLSHFEFNEKISFSEASVKYGVLIQSINKLFSSKLTIEDMYEQYLDYTKDIILLNQFINSLLVVDMINTNFNDIITNTTFFKSLINKELIIYDVNILDDNENKLKMKTESVYKKIREKPILKGNHVNGNLIILVFIISMGNSYFIDKNLPDLMGIMNYFSKYNNIYINNLNLSLFLYLYLIIAINLYLNASKNKKQFLNYESCKNNNFYYLEFNENDMNIEINNYNKNFITNPYKRFPLKLSQRTYRNKPYNILSLYLFDNESIFYEGENPSIKLLIFQNYLKLYAFYHLSKNKIKFTINLYIESIYDLLLHIYNSKNNLEKVNNENNNNLESNIFSNIEEEEIKQINLSKIDIFNKENNSLCFNSFNFLGLSIFVTGFLKDYQIARIISINLDLIKKSKKCYLQESA